MSLTKVVLSGIIAKSLEKRYTSNNIPVTNFVMEMPDGDGSLVRVMTKGKLAEGIIDTVDKGDKVLVEGSLQAVMVKMDDGSERKVIQIDAITVEKFAGGTGSSVAKTKAPKEMIQFAEEEFTDELIGEDEIPF